MLFLISVIKSCNNKQKIVFHLLIDRDFLITESFIEVIILVLESL